MSQRKRGRSLSADGIAAVQTELSSRGWSYRMLADHAELSISTIKRMLNGEPKDACSLQQAFETLEIALDVATHLIQPAEPVPSITLVADSASLVEVVQVSSNTILTFFMNATFLDTKIPQIRCALVALREQLLDGEVVFDEARNQLTVSGVFTPEAKASIEATIRHLEKLFLSCQLTGDIAPAQSHHPQLAVASVIERAD